MSLETEIRKSIEEGVKNVLKEEIEPSKNNLQHWFWVIFIVAHIAGFFDYFMSYDQPPTTLEWMRYNGIDDFLGVWVFAGFIGNIIFATLALFYPKRWVFIAGASWASLRFLRYLIIDSSYFSIDDFVFTVLFLMKFTGFFIQEQSVSKSKKLLAASFSGMAVLFLLFVNFGLGSPGISQVKRDLLGKQCGVWNFDSEDEFEAMRIISSSRDGFTLTYEVSANMVDFKSRSKSKITMNITYKARPTWELTNVTCGYGNW
jgi:hypothetical protein